MLTSSDAKWRCLWHMLIWSILLTLVSQFLNLTDHVAFYLFGGISVIILPILTSVYSNTAGRHGAGLLRAGYVFCDPVLTCLTISPVLFLNHLPEIVHGYSCFEQYNVWNESVQCTRNKSSEDHVDKFRLKTTTFYEHQLQLTKYKNSFLILQGSLVVPVIIALLMGKRTRKMKVNTYFLNFFYWFVMAAETVHLMEVALLREAFTHAIFTTLAMLSIVTVAMNSYAIVTLCSYVTPVSDGKASESIWKFDFLYIVFMSTAGVSLGEIPLLVARSRIIAADSEHILPGPFYVWIIKDILVIVYYFGNIIFKKCGKKKLFSGGCAPAFDNSEVFFQPEKRDVYIHTYQHTQLKSALKDSSKNSDSSQETDSTESLQDKKVKKVRFNFGKMIHKETTNPNPPSPSPELAKARQIVKTPNAKVKFFDFQDLPA